jgi:hypothetical protein
MSATASPEKNGLVRPAAIIVLGMMIAWNCAGWWIDKCADGVTFEGGFLVLFTAAWMALGINASSQLRRAHASVDSAAVRLVRKFWVLVLGATSLWSAGSAHHAYGVLVADDIVWAWTFEAVFALLNAAPLLIVLTLGAFFEPLLMWAIETVEHAARKSVPALQTKAETPAPARPEPIAPRGPAPLRETRERPALSRAAKDQPGPSLPLNDAELARAIQSVADAKGAEVVSLASVARAAETMLDRRVPKKRVEQHPRRVELFEAVKRGERVANA